MTTKTNMSIFGDGIGKAMLNARELAGISRAEMARRVGVSAEAVARWERGDYRPSVENLFGYVDVCDITLDDLVDFTGAEYAPLIKVTSRQRWDVLVDAEEGVEGC